MKRALLSLSLVLVACGEDEVASTSPTTAALTAEQCSYFAVDDRITICHRTSSATKPYTIVRTNIASCGGHADHEGDYVAYDDPTCSGQGCLPYGAPTDGTVECCGNLVDQAGTCGCPTGFAASPDARSCVQDDHCPDDPDKTEPGLCGCGISDADADGDGRPDCQDACPNDPFKLHPGVCGCGVSDGDSDFDGTADCFDACPVDSNKTAPGACGCNVPETDSDGDGTPDCHDGCDVDPNKTEPGLCGCGTADADTDGDGLADCNDACPLDPDKTVPGDCGCGVPEDSCCAGAGTPIGGMASTVASSNRPGQVSVDASSVFWGSWPSGPTAGAMWRASKTGGSAQALFTLPNTNDYVQASAADGADVFFGVSDGTIRKVPAAGGPASVVASPGIGLQFFAVDATHLYFTKSVSGVGGIYRMAKATGAISTIDASSAQVCRAGLAVDATHVYWAEDGCFSCSTSTGRILKAPLAGGAPVVIASGQPHPNFVAVDDGNVYWSNLCSGTIVKAPKAGDAPPTTLASGQAAPQGIAAHDGFVYWTNSNSANPAVMRVPACGGAPATLFAGGANPQTLVTDGTSLFWNDFNGGAVMKLP